MLGYRHVGTYIGFRHGFFVTRNDEGAYAESQYMCHSKRCATPVSVTLEFYGIEVIAST